MKTFKALSALLSYPEINLIETLDEITTVLTTEGLLPSASLNNLSELVEMLGDRDLLALQEDYVALFDRGRSTSLHLYEHVHGESRARGQAMVELSQLYRLHGLAIAAHELPDYLPLFLEFLSVLPLAAARSMLDEALPIIAAIRIRVAERKSAYVAVFAALEAVAAGSPDREAVASLLANLPPEEDSLAALDRRWEEETIRFLASSAGDCGMGSSRPTTSRAGTADLQPR